jgi:hypothetical protein
MTELRLVTTTGDRVVGTIRIEDGAAVFTGRSAEVIFRNTQRQRQAKKSDQEIFDLLAQGWSNGPLKLVAQKAAQPQGG